jgi:parallel beta-helix repeat protein
MKKGLDFVLILIFIMAIGTVYFLPIKAQTQSFFLINADGNVSPSTLLIKQTGNIYAFTGDMDITVFTIQKSNIIIEGDSHFLTNGQISMLSVTNVTVQNLSITNTWSIIIVLNDTSDIEIANTTITSAVTPFGMIGGILIENSSSVTIIRNTIKSGMFGILLSESHHNSIVQNYLTDNSNGWGYYSAGVI